MDEPIEPPDPLEQKDLEPQRQSDNVCITDSAEAFSIVQESVLGLWEVVNALATIRPARRERYRVTIFGSARMQPDSPIYRDVRWLAGELTAMGCDIITGGGPGLMQAANEGSVRADPGDRTQSVGIRVDLGFEQHANPFVEQVYRHRTFFSRLHHFVLQSDAFVVVPGGIGTTLEALMIWQLLQVRRLQDTPLIAIGPMWADLVKWSQIYMLKTDPPMADLVDTQIPTCVDDFEAAIAILREAKASWQPECQ
ncbi:LOG family protein [Altericista sp. CCNU0014]|uniref:LOG family protein n=1 Tax=Altericista sp. CCNU0014 TaxID=3082949 RepID=UPI00384C1168